jgi:hypothetical protein
MSTIESIKNQLLHYVPCSHTDISDQIHQICKKLEDLNVYNVNAWLPVVHDVDMGKCEMIPGETFDYDDLEQDASYQVRLKDGTWETLGQDEYEELLDTWRNELEELEDEINELDTGGEDDNELQCRRAERDELENLIIDAERADPEYDDIMWYTSWRPYGDDVDEAIVAQIPGLISYRVRGDSYLSLGTSGMDMGPSLAAYMVMAHGVLPAWYSSHFTSASSREYARYVMGNRCFEKVCEILKITDKMKLVEDRDAALKEEAKRAQAEEEAARKRIRDAGLTATQQAQILMRLTERYPDNAEKRVYARANEAIHPDNEAEVNKWLCAVDRFAWLRDIFAENNYAFPWQPEPSKP